MKVKQTEAKLNEMEVKLKVKKRSLRRAGFSRLIGSPCSGPGGRGSEIRPPPPSRRRRLYINLPVNLSGKTLSHGARTEISRLIFGLVNNPSEPL